MNLHAWSPTVTAWLMPFIIMASENGVCSQGEQCVCFNMALSLLGLKCKIRGTKHWLQRGHQIGFSFYSPGRTCGGQNWQRWETFGRNWHFILYLGITKNTSKIMWGFFGFLHMQCLFSPLYFPREGCCPSVLLLLEDLCHINHYTNIYGDESLWHILYVVFSNICIPPVFG